jgi:hypothetical protein
MLIKQLRAAAAEYLAKADAIEGGKPDVLDLIQRNKAASG